MNDKKIEIMIHATNEKYFSELIKSLEAAIIPENFLVEVQPVTGEEKYFAYETARQASDAKYKIYLDERAIITDRNFLNELLRIFRADEKIGAIGTSGAIELSTHGVSLTSHKRADENYFGEVEMLDGFLFATQYDLPWRTDYSDNYFGGQAQCAEFKRAGYKLFIGGSWIYYRGENFKLNDASRKKFLEEYSADLFPLVTVIIPTFNRPKYFREALESALAQTYRNIEVVISDNSTEDDTEKLVQNYLYDARIKYFRHKDFNANDNWNFARDYDNPAAEYVNWLMDDDLFYPTKIETMIEIYRNNPEISLVTSARHVIDANGRIIANAVTFFENTAKMTGDEAGKLLMTTFKNFIGEPTTVLIKKKYLRGGDLCWHEDERGFFNLIDVSTWLHILTQGDLFFLNEPLSCYREHPEIASGWAYTPPLMAVQWAKLIKSAWERKIFLKTEEDFRRAIIAWLEFPVVRGLTMPLSKKYHGAEVVTLEKTLVAMAKSLLNGYRIELPPVEYSAQDKFKTVR